jgi:hypothetical protein
MGSLYMIQKVFRSILQAQCEQQTLRVSLPRMTEFANRCRAQEHLHL